MSVLLEAQTPLVKEIVIERWRARGGGGDEKPHWRVLERAAEDLLDQMEMAVMLTHTAKPGHRQNDANEKQPFHCKWHPAALSAKLALHQMLLLMWMWMWM